jgi:translation elongation factor EF-Tu-like GTPase
MNHLSGSRKSFKEMKIKEIVDYYYNPKSEIIQVSFRLNEDGEDEIREHEFELDFVEKSGFFILENYDYESNDLPIIYEEDTDELIIDEEASDEKEYEVDVTELKDFMEEFYKLNPKKIPPSFLF